MLHSNAKIYFYPRKPDVRHSIWRICDILDIGFAKSHGEAEIGFLGDGSTICTPPPKFDGIRFLNSNCLNISKSYVDKCFYDAFGYSLSVDPQHGIGPCVRKSEKNYTHDGVILQRPIPLREPNMVYNILVNNSCGPTLIEDLRVVVIGKRIPLVFVRRRPIAERFSDDDVYVCPTAATEVFDLSEIHSLIRFCEMIGMDFGELDVLRNKDEENRLYVVDANRTPASPPRALSYVAGHRAMITLAHAFSEEFLSLDRSEFGPPPNQYHPMLAQSVRAYRWLTGSGRAGVRILRTKF